MPAAPGTPKTIEPRQKELDLFYSWLFPREKEPSLSPNGSPSGAAGFALNLNHDLSDEDILSRAYRAANADKFMKLWNGDTSDYESHSEADLALCAKLTFWTGPDPERIERMFFESRLSQRSKWRERPRYRRNTVEVVKEDVRNAARIVAYFKAHARRVYGELQATTPEDLLAGEIRDFLQDHDGEWSGSATELYEELEEREAPGLPENADWLSRVVLSIGDRSDLLGVRKKRTGQRRFLKLTLKNGVTGVIGVTHRGPGSDTSDTNDTKVEEIKWID